MKQLALITLCAICLSLGGQVAYGAPSYQPIGGYIYVPSIGSFLLNSALPNGLSSLTCDSTTDVIGPVFRIGKVSGRITHVFVNPVNYASGTGADTTVKVRLETVDVDGFASGTLFTGAAEKTINIEVDGTGLGGRWLDLGADSVSVATGNEIAQAMSANNATASGNFTLATGFLTAIQPLSSSLPRVMAKTTSTETSDDLMPIGGYKMNGKPVMCGMFPIDSVKEYPSTTWDSASTIDEVGMKFQMPWACKIGGMFFYVRSTTSSRYVHGAMTLYDANNTVLYSDTVGGYSSITTSNLAGVVTVIFDNDITITANTVYRMAFAPITSDDHIAYVIRVTDSTDWYAFDGGGPKWHGTARGDSTGGGGSGLKSGWTDYTNPNPNYRWLCGLMITQLSADAGGDSGRRRIMMFKTNALVIDAVGTFAGGRNWDEIPR